MLDKNDICFEKLKKEAETSYIEPLDLEHIIEPYTYKSGFPEYLEEIQKDMKATAIKIRALKMGYEALGELPITPMDSDFDQLNHSMEYIYQELLTLISGRHFIKKVYSSGHQIKSVIKVD
ncbi:MAG: hypothetical protein JEZ08_17985 [Clostridiales bacterium]|nr:hypothetical protein [Clostridiales bacterium]